MLITWLVCVFWVMTTSSRSFCRCCGFDSGTLLWINYYQTTHLPSMVIKATSISRECSPDILWQVSFSPQLHDIVVWLSPLPLLWVQRSTFITNRLELDYRHLVASIQKTRCLDINQALDHLGCLSSKWYASILKHQILFLYAPGSTPIMITFCLITSEAHPTYIVTH